MRETVLTFSLFGLTFYGYGTALAVGALLSALLLRHTLRASGQTSQWLPMLLWILPFGLIGARLLYCLCILRGLILDNDLAFVLRFADGGYMLYGAMGGGALGLLCCAKVRKTSFKALANAVAPAAALMIAIARAAECMTGAGVGWSVDNEALHFFPVAVMNEWEEWKFAVFAWEAVVALGLTIDLLIRRSKKLPTVEPFLIVYATSQLLMESLRKDDVMSFGFVKASMLISAVLLAGIVVRRLVKRVRGAWWTLAGLLAGLGGIIALEFALDKSTIANEFLYGAMAVIVAGLCRGLLRGCKDAAKA